MRPVNRDFVSFIRSAVKLSGPVFEFGSFQVDGGGASADLRDLFPGMEYAGCDMRPGPGVDRVIDLVDTRLPDRHVGTMLLLDTLEHVQFPRAGMAEARRVLAPDGAVLITTVMNFAIHAHPDDYWRFTPSGMRSLLQDFEHSWVGAVGDDDHPVSILAVAAGPDFPLPDLVEPLSHWVRGQQQLHRALSASPDWSPARPAVREGEPG